MVKETAAGRRMVKVKAYLELPRWRDERLSGCEPQRQAKRSCPARVYSTAALKTESGKDY